MIRSVASVLALILVTVPVSAQEPQGPGEPGETQEPQEPGEPQESGEPQEPPRPQQLVQAACADLLEHLPEAWPEHVAADAAATFELSVLINRSTLREADVGRLTQTAQIALDSNPRLRQAGDDVPTLVVLGGWFGSSDREWAALLLCDVARNTVLAVGLANRALPEGGRALVERLEARAAEGWPEGLPLAASGKPVLRVVEIENRSRRRDMDLPGLGVGLSAALVRSGVVEVAVPRHSDPRQAIESARERAAQSEAGGAIVQEARVGLIASGLIEGRDGETVQLTVVGTHDGSTLVELTVSAPRSSRGGPLRPEQPPREPADEDEDEDEDED